jgi:YVTN family beta-propeller protein
LPVGAGSALDIIDTTSLMRTKSIPMTGRLHNTYVAPDGKTLWVTSIPANAVFIYSLPDVTLQGHVTLPVKEIAGRDKPVPAVPNWVTFTPDSKLIYISNAAAKSVTAIDMQARKVVAVIPVGEVPKRIGTLVMR